MPWKRIYADKKVISEQVKKIGSRRHKQRGNKMKKIKRTITIRKVEFFSNKQHDLEKNVEVCPLCHSPIHVLTPANDSAVEIPAAEIPLKLAGQKKIELKGDDND